MLDKKRFYIKQQSPYVLFEETPTGRRIVKFFSCREQAEKYAIQEMKKSHREARKILKDVVYE